MPATFQKLQINHNSPMMRIEMRWKMILIIIIIMILSYHRYHCDLLLQIQLQTVRPLQFGCV